MMTKEQQHRKTVAALICLLLGYLYIETVFLPYFYPERYLPQKSIVEVPSVEKESKPLAKEDEGQISPQSFSEEALKEEIESPLVEKTVSKATEEDSVADFAYYPSDAAIAKAGSLQIENEKFEVHFSLLGGRISNLFLKEYKEKLSKDSGLLDLITHVEGAPYPLGVYSGEENDAFVSYRLISGQDVRDGRIKVEDKTELVFEGMFGDGRTIRKVFRFDADSHMLGVDVLLSRAPTSASQLKLEWTQFVSQEDLKSSLNPYSSEGFSWFNGEVVDRLSFSKLEEARRQIGEVTWILLGDKYFITALLSRDNTKNAQVLKTGQLYRARINGTDNSGSFALYLGPKSYKTLSEYGFDLEKSIDFGFTGIIAAPLLELLLLLDGLFGNYGLAIIALTILVKLALYPLSISQFKQMKGMQAVAPEIKRIKESIKDPREQQAAIMQLYKKKGVNPFGGCLPMLLQMPIFIGLYSALMLAVELRHAPFALWVVDLSAPEKLMIAGFGVPVMVILFVLSMMVQQWITPSTADPAQKKMMMFMPIIFGFMFMNFPAGLTLYWLTNNLISIGQTQSAHRDMKKGQGVKITLGIALVIFTVAFVLTKL